MTRIENAPLLPLSKISITIRVKVSLYSHLGNFPGVAVSPIGKM